MIIINRINVQILLFSHTVKCLLKSTAVKFPRRLLSYLMGFHSPLSGNIDQDT